MAHLRPARGRAIRPGCNTESVQLCPRLLRPRAAAAFLRGVARFHAFTEEISVGRVAATWGYRATAHGGTGWKTGTSITDLYISAPGACTVDSIVACLCSRSDGNDPPAQFDEDDGGVAGAVKL